MHIDRCQVLRDNEAQSKLLQQGPMVRTVCKPLLPEMLWRLSMLDVTILKTFGKNLSVDGPSFCRKRWLMGHGHTDISKLS
jgi:hypothetical protein